MLEEASRQVEILFGTQTPETNGVDLGPDFSPAEENTLANVIDSDFLLLCRCQNGDSNNLSMGLKGGSNEWQYPEILRVVMGT